MDQAENPVHEPMSGEALNAVVESAMPYVANATIGFMKLDHAGAITTDAAPIGSGTLARLGEVCGVITAAHVLTAIPNKQGFGIVRFSSRYPVQRMHTELSEIDRVAVGIENTSKDGPDIAFVRLSADAVGWLKALGGNFVNIAKDKHARLDGKREGLQFIRAVSGVISERTRRRIAESNLTVAVEASFTPGKLRNRRKNGEFDFIDIELLQDDSSPLSYGGTSGGGVWRIPIYSSNHELAGNPTLDGVAFFESGLTTPRSITCHGPDSIYSQLRILVADRWPQSTQ
jgi:hypothetical protein